MNVCPRANKFNNLFYIDVMDLVSDMGLYSLAINNI